MVTKYKNILKAQKEVFQKCYNVVSNTRHENLKNTIYNLAKSIISYSNTEYSRGAFISSVWLKTLIW